MRGSQNKFEIIINFMEKNGDLGSLPQTSQGRLENLQKWHELVDLLNDKLGGEAKSVQKWRKTWSDFKNNTKKKMERIKKHGGEGPELSDIEKRVLRLMGNKVRRKRKLPHLDSEDNMVFKEETDDDHRSLSPLHYFCPVNPRHTSTSSASMNSSLPSKKRKKSIRTDNLEKTDKFLEFEREREKMSHEREMARIRQNDDLLSVFGRIVNVLERLAPSIQRYLDRNSNGDG